MFPEKQYRSISRVAFLCLTMERFQLFRFYDSCVGKKTIDLSVNVKCAFAATKTVSHEEQVIFDYQWRARVKAKSERCCKRNSNQKRSRLGSALANALQSDTRDLRWDDFSKNSNGVFYACNESDFRGKRATNSCEATGCYYSFRNYRTTEVYWRSVLRSLCQRKRIDLRGPLN